LSSSSSSTSTSVAAASAAAPSPPPPPSSFSLVKVRSVETGYGKYMREIPAVGWLVSQSDVNFVVPLTTAGL